jgi:hypothetical protein
VPSDYQLRDRRPTPRRRFLVFSSAGDRANLHRWLHGRRIFDLWITYYGAHRDRYAESADIYCARKGSKFQNLKDAYDRWPDIVRSYDAVLVLDDDILISARRINRLFEIQQQLDLWVVQPAFSPLGRITIPITRVQWRCDIRYTNFVEMTCPLFRRDKLDAFMAVYDPVLTGYGTDWWFLDVLGPDLSGRVAVIDRITCVNPHEHTKGGVREIDTLEPYAVRKATWEKVRAAYDIRSDLQGRLEYRRVLKPFPRRWFSFLKDELLATARSEGLLALVKSRTPRRWPFAKRQSS